MGTPICFQPTLSTSIKEDTYIVYFYLGRHLPTYITYFY